MINNWKNEKKKKKLEREGESDVTLDAISERGWHDLAVTNGMGNAVRFENSATLLSESQTQKRQQILECVDEVWD